MRRAPAADPAYVLFDGLDHDPRLDHPEGICVDPRDGAIWCGGEAGQIYRLDPVDKTLEQVADCGGFCLGLAFEPAGTLLVCNLTRRQLLRVTPDTGVIEVVSRGAPEHPLQSPNACLVDAAGRIYVSDSGRAGDSQPGLLRVEISGETKVWCHEPLNFANGIALSADGDALFVAETWERRIVRVAIAPDGSAGDLSTVADLAHRLPDGLAVATDGALWVACYQPSEILRVADGAVEVMAEDPDAHVLCHPTNLAFAGSRLVIANLGRWHLSALETTSAGVAVPPETAR
jgi:gluconolactonase